MSTFINGRFLSQPVTGVQRFSIEITEAIDRLGGAGEWPDTALLMPKRAGDRGDPRFRRLQARRIGRTNGHVWEQTELPVASQGGVLVSLGNTAPVLAGGRQVVVIHDAGVFDTPDSYSRRFRAWYKMLQFTLARRGAHIVTVSDFSRRRIAASLHLDPDRISVIFEGSDHILRVEPDPDTLRRHRLQAGKFALIVSNRAAHKNFGVLRETVSMLSQRGLVTAAAGAFYAGVFRSAEDEAAERRLGRVSDAELRALYASAACLLFPSRYEGFGLPPIEAMACGCPVVAVRSGAVEEVCGDAALYAEPDDGAGLRQATERLVDDVGLVDAMRSRGLARAAAFSWDASARRLGDVVSRLQ